MHAAMLTVLLTIATPDELNGAILLPPPEIERRRELFKRPEKVPSVVRVHRFRK